MNTILLAILLNSLVYNQSSSLFSTHFLGLDKHEIMEKMQTGYKQLKLNTSNVNHAYNYLKYEDFINEITVYFFLTDDDKCKRIRFIGDYSNLDDVILSLNSSYERIGKNQWQYTANQKNYAVNLDEGDWFFTVTIKNKDEAK
jgi:hypothetical protein